MSSDPVDQLVAAAHKAAAYGLLRCSSGNLSCRLDETHLLITASRTWLAELTPADIVRCRLADGQSADGGEARPSVESRFHTGILRHRPEVQVVLHYQAPYSTAVACRRDAASLDYFVVPEIPYYIGPIGQISYLPPGSAELAEAVIQTMRTHNLAIMANHGQVVVGKDFDDAIQRAVFFELACEIITRAADKLRPLSTDAAADLRQA